MNKCADSPIAPNASTVGIIKIW